MITLIGTNGLFTRLGKIFKLMMLINEHEGNNLIPGVNTIVGEYASPLIGVPAALAGNAATYLTGAESPASDLDTAAEQTVIQMVHADKPSKAGSLASALAEVIYQMQTGSATVQLCTPGYSTAVYPSSGGNTGDGVILLGVKRGDGLNQENIVAEVAPIVCTADAQTGGATVNQEQFTFVGAADAGNPYSYLWPTGSGGSATLTAVDATQNNAGGNLLTNSGFTNWTSGVPNNWTADVGTPGTDFQQNNSVVYQGGSSFEFIGGTSALTSISQQFDSSSGTLGSVSSLTSLAVNFRIKADVVPASGILKVELVGGATSGSLSVLNDAQSNANSATITLSGVSTSWVAHNVIFRLPRVLPAIVKLRFVLTTAVPSGSNIFLDSAAAALLTPLYPGGPGCVVFSGATPFINGDGWLVTTTNDRGGSSFNATFQTMFDRFFGMRALGLLLPSTASSPTIADTLISS